METKFEEILNRFDKIDLTKMEGSFAAVFQ
jgi:hypothetical protein